MTQETLPLDTPEAVRLPLQGIPLQDMLDKINAENRGLFVRMVR